MKAEYQLRNGEVIRINDDRVSVCHKQPRLTETFNLESNKLFFITRKVAQVLEELQEEAIGLTARMYLADEHEFRLVVENNDIAVKNKVAQGMSDVVHVGLLSVRFAMPVEINALGRLIDDIELFPSPVMVVENRLENMYA